MLPLGEVKDAPTLGSLEMGHKLGSFLLVLPDTRVGQPGYHVSLIPHVASSVSKSVTRTFPSPNPWLYRLTPPSRLKWSKT